MIRLAGTLLLVLSATLAMACQQPTPTPVVASATPVVMRITATPNSPVTVAVQSQAPAAPSTLAPTKPATSTSALIPGNTSTPTATLERAPTPTVAPAATPTPSPTPALTATPTPPPTPALSPDPQALMAVKGKSQMFKPVVGEGTSQVAVELSPDAGDLSVLVPELDCDKPRNTLDLSGKFFWVRWCELGQATLSITDPDSGVGQSYPITVVEPTPLPPTPTPGPPHDPVVRFDSLQGTFRLSWSMPERERQIRELPWIADGLLYAEHGAAQGLIYLALHGGDYFPKFMEHTWVVKGRNKPAMESPRWPGYLASQSLSKGYQPPGHP